STTETTSSNSAPSNSAPNPTARPPSESSPPMLNRMRPPQEELANDATSARPTAAAALPRVPSRFTTRQTNRMPQNAVFVYPLGAKLAAHHDSANTIAREFIACV